MEDSADSNVYVRLSLMRPKPGQADQVTDILNSLVNFYAQQSGYLQGYTLISSAPGSEIGRLTLWKGERDAENVANTQHVLALRSELLRLVEPGSHEEKSFLAESRPAPQPAT